MNKYNTSIYRKPTFTGQYLELDFFCPCKQKINLMNTLVHHALIICSNNKLQSELDHIRSIMFKNPNLVVNSAIIRKLQNLNRLVQFGPSKCLVYLHFPWLGTVSRQSYAHYLSTTASYQKKKCLLLFFFFFTCFFLVYIGHQLHIYQDG